MRYATACAPQGPLTQARVQVRISVPSSDLKALRKASTGQGQLAEASLRVVRGLLRRSEETNVLEPSAGCCNPACTAAAGTRLLTCTRCETTRYCRRKCQAAHFRVHKKVCEAPPEPGEFSAEAGRTGASTQVRHDTPF